MNDKALPCYICKCDDISIQFQAQYSEDGRYEGELVYYECLNGHQSDKIIPTYIKDEVHGIFAMDKSSWNIKQTHLEADDIYKSIHNPSVKSKTKTKSL